MRIAIFSLITFVAGLALAQTRVFSSEATFFLSATQRTQVTNLVDNRSPGCNWQSLTLAKEGSEIRAIVPCKIAPATVSAIPDGACIRVE